MVINVETKWKVGDIVAIRTGGARLIIEQIITVTCPAGTQIFYEGFMIYGELHRVYSKANMPLEWQVRGTDPKVVRFNETSLEDIK